MRKILFLISFLIASCSSHNQYTLEECQKIVWENQFKMGSLPDECINYYRPAPAHSSKPRRPMKPRIGPMKIPKKNGICNFSGK